MPRSLSYMVLLLTPLMFSSNLLFGKSAVAGVEPWTLAFVRWSLVAITLFGFVWPDLRKHWPLICENWKMFFFMGFLAMWICGAIVYFALGYTSATNATLIYLSSPVIILLLETVVHNRPIKQREKVGIFIATAGVFVILAKGDIGNILALQFNIGDLAMVAAAISWAIYSVTLKSSALEDVSSAAILFLCSGAGALTLFPFAAVEIAVTGDFPHTVDIWLQILGIVFFSSFLAFLGYQRSVRFVGPAIAGIFMYLLPVYGVGLAVLILGEKFSWFHGFGIVTILGGVILATFPIRLVAGWFVAAERRDG